MGLTIFLTLSHRICAAHIRLRHACRHLQNALRGTARGSIVKCIRVDEVLAERASSSLYQPKETDPTCTVVTSLLGWAVAIWRRHLATRMNIENCSDLKEAVTSLASALE